MKKILTQVYSLEIPDNWLFESDDSGIVSMHDHKGRGALTISSYSSSSDSPDAVAMLERFVGGRGLVVRKEGKPSAAESEYEDSVGGKTVFVYAAAFCRGHQLILVSYNCNKDKLSKSELEQVHKAVEGLEFKDSK